MVLKTKLDEKFLIGCFVIESLGVFYKVDENLNSGWIKLYAR